MEANKKKLLRTFLLPEFIPRLRDLFGSGFGMIAYLIAVVYNTVRILPKNHPYLKKDMIGRVTILQVMREASQHVRMDRKNIDQIAIFFTILVGLILFIFQFIIIIANIFISTANAQAEIPKTVEGFFKTTDPSKDIAYRIMDLVFGVPGIFKTGIETTALQKALHAMFEFYSLGMVAVGAIIILYFVTTLVAETARSGVPFGQRSNKTWMAPRVILFFGLLIPLTHGINGGQYITLYTAKLGSALASSGWSLYQQNLKDEGATPTGPKEQNVAIPKPSDISGIPAFMLTAKTCQKAYEEVWTKEDYQENKKGEEMISRNWTEDAIKGWLVYEAPDGDWTKDPGGKTCSGEKVGDHIVLEMTNQKYTDIAACAKNDVFLVFGVKDPKKFEKYAGGVLPTCGSLFFSTTDIAQPGTASVQNEYLSIIQETWEGSVNNINEKAVAFVKRTMNIKPDPEAEIPGEDYIRTWMDYLDQRMEVMITNAVEAQKTKGDWQSADDIDAYGWGGAGIWYNKIAEQNGALVSAVRNPPRAVLMPKIQEQNRVVNEASNLNPTRQGIYSTTQSAESVMRENELPDEKEISNALNAVYLYWDGNKYNPERTVSKNIVIDTINVIFGTYGLFEMCKNVDIHPMAQLSAVGKAMIDSSVAALFATGITGIIAIIPTDFSPGMNAASGFFGSIASIGLLVGFILFYVLPFFPFIYFFFAIGYWVKTIFEAMVAIPLWALAHLRIDGEGIPGEAAIHGYYLLFEIFIRPILIVFGLIAAVTIFAAMVKVLNEIFYLVISNLSGNDARSNTVCFQTPDGASAAEKAAASKKQADLSQMYRGPIDEFFFTIVYTVIVFIIGQSCFKLIDMIPKQILRWLGVDMPNFNDEQGDSAAGLLQYVTLGGSQFGDKIGESVSGLGRGIQQSVIQFKEGK